MLPTYSLTPNTVESNDSWTNQASSIVAADVLAAINDSSDSNYITANTSAAAREVRFGLTSFAPRHRGIAEVRIQTRAKSANGSQVGTLQPYVVVGGTRYSGSAYDRSWSAEAWVYLETAWTTNPATGAPWTAFELESLVVGYDQSIDSSWFWQISYVYVEVTYVAASSDQERVRDVASRALDRRLRPSNRISIRVPLSVALQARPMDRIALEHWAARDSAGQPFGPRDWQRGQYVVREVTIHPGQGDGELLLEEWRPRAMLLWDGLATTRTPAGMEDGVARVMRGNTRTFSRASRAHVEDPESGLLYEVDAGQPKLTLDAEGAWYLHEGARTNALLNSSNVSGVAGAGWTNSGVEDDTTERLFEVTSPRAFKFNAGADVLSQTTGALAQQQCLSLDHKTGGSLAILWSAQRGSDGKWYRASDATWQAAEQDNTPAASADWHRDEWPIDLGSSTTLLLKLKGQAATTIHVAHAQLEAGKHATSRIVTTSAVATRAADSLLYAWATASRLLWADQGGAAVTVQPRWSAAAVSGWKTLLYLAHDANNGFRLGYHTSYGLVLEIEVAGVTYRATVAWSPVAGTVYRVAARWCSSRGEHGLTAYSLQVMLDGVLGTAAVAGAAMTEAASGNFEFGAAAAADYWDGGVRQLKIVQYVPTEAEMQRGLM